MSSTLAQEFNPPAFSSWPVSLMPTCALMLPFLQTPARSLPQSTSISITSARLASRKSGFVRAIWRLMPSPRNLCTSKKMGPKSLALAKIVYTERML